MAPKTSEKKELAPAGASVPAAAPSGPVAEGKQIVESVAVKVREFINHGQLHLPKDYSVDNALKSAWLILQTTKDTNRRPVLEACSRVSIYNTLLDMIVQGLNPAKKQAYFIAYGDQLTCQRSYFGSMAVAMMVQPTIGDFAYAVVYEDDKFSYGIKNGRKIVQEHEQKLENVEKEKVVAAYCIAFNKEGEPIRTEIMTFEEIKQAWRQSKMKPLDDNGNIRADSTHGRFTADMALKTVINKLCKFIINASSDNALLLERVNRAEDLADAAQVAEEIDAEANKGEVIEIPAGEAASLHPDGAAEGPTEEPASEAGQPQGEGAQGRVPGF